MTLRKVTQIADVAAAYQAGATIDELAARYGVGRGTIWRRLNAGDITKRRQGGVRAPASVVMAADPSTLGYIAGMFDG